MSTANLNLPEWVEAQAHPEVTHNDAITAIDSAVTEQLDVSLASGNVTLTSAQYRAHMEFTAIDVATTGRKLILPAVRRLVQVKSDAGNSDNIVVKVGTTEITMAPDSHALVTTDGTANGLELTLVGAAGIRDEVESFLEAGTNITIVRNSGPDRLTITSTGGGGGSALDKDRYAPPAASDFPNVYSTNSHSPVTTDTSGSGLVVDFGITPAGGVNFRGVTKAKAASSNYSIIARLGISAMNFNFTLHGLVISDGTKHVIYGYGTNSQSAPPTLQQSQLSNSTSFSANTLLGYGTYKLYEWFRWDVVSGDPKELYVSDNGIDWIHVATTSQTSFLTYTQVGVGSLVNPATGSPPSGENQASISVLYFSDPDITP